MKLKARIFSDGSMRIREMANPKGDPEGDTPNPDDLEKDMADREPARQRKENSLAALVKQLLELSPQDRDAVLGEVQKTLDGGSATESLRHGRIPTKRKPMARVPSVAEAMRSGRYRD